MKKKVIILLSVTIILLLIIGGVFLWPYYKQMKIEKEMEKLADFVVKETSEGKIVESKDGKLKVIIPEGWRTKRQLIYQEKKLKESEYFIARIEILNPELFTSFYDRKEENIYNSKTGCLIEISFIEGKKTIEDLKKDIEENRQYLRLDSEYTFETIEINNRDATKTEFKSSLFGYCVSIVIPSFEKNYTLTMFSGLENKDKCFQEFNKILDKISIK